ncbi:MAG: hypothetical protein RI519_07120 [Balneolaceae bacterium]|nr:hypothetical protein [Balneolaceae bacterium]
MKLNLDPLLFFLLLLLFASCSDNETVPPKEEEFVAFSEDWTITKQELKQNVGFANPELTRGDDPVRDVLDLMIAEKALAAEAKTRGYTERQEFEEYTNWITHEEMIEHVFQRAILDTITVSEQEIREEIYRQAVRFSFRYLIAPDKQQAFYLRDVAMNEGFRVALSYLRDDQTGQPVSPEAFQTPLVKANQLSQSFLQNIQEVELNQYSSPFQHEGQWWVVQPTNITRTPIAEDEIALESESARKIVYNRKALHAGDKWIASMMEPLEVTTKRDVFIQLVEAFYPLVEGEEVTQTAIKELLEASPSKFLTSTLVTTTQSSYTVQQLLQWMIPETVPLRTESKKTFTQQLSDAIAITIRDQELLQWGIDRDLPQDPILTRKVGNWQDKWLYQQRSLDLRNGGDVRSREALRHYADSLVSTMEINIDQKALDELKEDSLITPNDRYVQLLKQNSNRPAFPLIDPYW